MTKTSHYSWKVRLQLPKKETIMFSSLRKGKRERERDIRRNGSKGEIERERWRNRESRNQFHFYILNPSEWPQHRRVLFLIQQIYIYIYIYVCVCVCKGILQSSKSRVGKNSIPSGQLNYSKFKHLNIPGKELNVNDIIEQREGALL